MGQLIHRLSSRFSLLTTPSTFPFYFPLSNHQSVQESKGTRWPIPRPNFSVENATCLGRRFHSFQLPLSEMFLMTVASLPQRTVIYVESRSGYLGANLWISICHAFGFVVSL